MSRSLTVVSFGLVLLSLQNVAGQLSFHSDKDVLSKLAVFEKYIYIGGGKNLYKLNANLVPEEIIPTCTSNCTNSVNQLLLINENETEIVICGTGNDGLCSHLDLNNLYGKKTTGSLKVPVDPHFPAVGLVTEDHKDLMVARSVCGNNTFLKKDEYIIVIASWNFKTMNIPEGVNANGNLKYLKLKTSSSGDPSFCIKYQQVLEDSGFSYFFTNQNKYSNTHDTVSKVSRICQRDEYYQTYIDAEIACHVGGKSYNILTDAVLVNGKVFASFSKSDGLFKSVICFKDIQQLNSSLVNEKLDFILGNCTLNETQSYLADDKSPACQNPQNLTEITSPEFTCADIPHSITHNYKRVIGKTTIPFNYSDTNVEGKITKLFTTTVNQKSILLAGTESGHVIQFSILEHGTLHKYDTSSVPASSSREDNRIHDLYHFPDGDALYALTKSTIFRINARSCSETGILVCTQSEKMKLKDPHCGWCVFENKLSQKSECQDKWISSMDECITLSLSPQGVKVGKNNVSISIYSDELPNANYTCGINGKNATARKYGSSLTCSVDVSEISASHHHTTFGLYEETRKVLVAEAPFLFFNCSVYSKCGQCVRKAGAQCSWCPVQGVCVDEVKTCKNDGDIWMNWQVNQTDGCPRLTNNNEQLYIHNGQNTSVQIKVENLNRSENHLQKILVEFSDNNETCNYTDDQISCSLNYEFQGRGMIKKKNTVPIRVFYQYSGRPETSISELEDDFNNTVTVYDCGGLGKRGCNFCKALSCDRYKCKWDNSTQACAYTSACSCAERNTSNGQSGCNDVCPIPNITEISPKDGPCAGSVSVTVNGTELGVETQNLTVISISEKRNGAEPYVHTKEVWYEPEDKSDFYLRVRTGFIYVANSHSYTNNQKMKFYLGNQYYTLPIAFDLKNSSLTDIFPKSGPQFGGTRVTLYGTNLGIGNQVVGRISIGTDGKVQPIGTNAENYTVEFTTKHGTGTHNINFDLNGHKLNNPKVLNFTYLKDPDIMGIEPSKAFLSGGTVMTVTGKDFTNANVGKITLVVDGAKSAAEFCEITKNRTDEMLCKIPRAPTQVKEQLDDEPSRKKRAADCDGCVSVDIIISLDGVEKSFTLSYYHDPSIYKFGDGVVLFSSEEQYLKIKGDKLDLVATTSDFKITIGVEECSVIEVKDSYMTCKAPRTQPKPEKPGQSLPEVKVSVGNIHTTVGYIQYKQDPNILIIAGASAAAAVFLLVMVITFFVCKYRKVGSKARALEKQLNNLELEIKHVAKEEFLDMQTSMSTVNRNLIEQGFPYHSYQQYACNAMFATDYLMSDPVMSDELRARARTGMERFQGLLENKFFLVSLITTMEKQKHFFIKEKSNFAGNLCAIMMGRMDYMHEVLQVLITQLVEDPSSKRGVKSLFRRSESITEKLLSNWLSLCLYPHLKDHTGSLLYLLYIATRKTMEAGPIDALTNDAKYTLSEEKLLRKYQGSATDEETTDVKFEAKALTLNVVVDNGEEIYPCKALDCDTVNQVKAKCLDQIYVNYPASQLPVDPTELLLEWHAGFSGRMILRDKDNTSKRDGEWIRVNTLAHYAVADQSNMALVDPRNAELSQQEDYVNLAQIDPGFDVNSMGSDQPLTAECSTSHDEENPMELKQWHLLKDDDANKKEKSAIDELYLNRLITTKLSLVKYIDDLFSLVLESSKCPPPVKFLYDFLDDLAEKQKIDPDTLHAWKSHSYSIRIWAMLIKTPSILFDINAPSYVSESLDVISQVFIESFSRTEQAVSKESPTQKLIFRNELTKFRTHVQEFYKNVKENVQKPDELGQYLTSINRNQQETTFNKNAALYRLYEQIKPYTDEILDDLSICQETRCLQLNKKLDDIFSMMEE